LYYDGETLDFTGIKLMGVYMDYEAENPLEDFVEKEITDGFTINPPQGTVVHCSAKDEAIIGIIVQSLWIIILVPAGAFIMKRITRLSVIQGG
jgi:hypothetical protein